MCGQYFKWAYFRDQHLSLSTELKKVTIKIEGREKTDLSYSSVKRIQINKKKQNRMRISL